MLLNPPSKPVSWELRSEVVNIFNEIKNLEHITSQSFAGMTNWRDKESMLMELEVLRKRGNIIIKNAKEQYDIDMKKYEIDIKDYQVALEEQKVAEEIMKKKQKTEEEAMKKKYGHSILGLDV